MSKEFNHDVLIIGSGAAGLTLALSVAEVCKVAIIHKSGIQNSSTRFAQGGIAAVLSETDTTDAHINDTLNAGGGLCHEDAVKFTVESSKKAVQWLVEQGVDFSKTVHDDGTEAFHLTKEGGHSHRRILHSADATGLAVSSALIDAANEHPNIELFGHHVAVDLITVQDPTTGLKRCTGCYILDRESDSVNVFQAKFVVLATGGASKVYLYTSNPDGASGDGIAMAWRAGCRVANMEFNQFHPTCLYHPNAKSFLITEALRGEGAHLLLPNGERFMKQFHSDGELAPRDIVARAIDHEMKRLGCDCVYLDISHRTKEFILSHFPTVSKRCLEYGVDITQEPIPIVPAAHYTCGGVMINRQGRTDIDKLYAVGETSFTGLHGANRMASNSLLECIVYGQSAAEDIKKSIYHTTPPPIANTWDESQVTNSDEDVVISHNWDELRRFMWDYVGIVRTDKRLERAKRRIELLQLEIHEYYSNYKVSNDLLELRNLAVIAKLIVDSAARRKESRGLHFTLDYPELADTAEDTILIPDNYQC